MKYFNGLKYQKSIFYFILTLGNDELYRLIEN